MQQAWFMDKGHEFRFSAALVMLSKQGVNTLRIAPAGRGADIYVGIDVGGFVTALLPDEVDNITKTSKKVDSMPKIGTQFVEALQACSDHIREEQAAARKRMI